MQIHQAEFVTSAAVPSEYPEGEVPEIAFAGRSNVGKSSLMNSLLGRKSLVRTSKTPGRTQRLNFFDADGRFRLVDLPGYGWAHVPMTERASWKQMVETYLLKREQLVLCVVLVDIRHEAMRLDLDMLEFLQASGLPHQIVATKADKLGRGAQQKALGSLRRAFGQGLLPYSAETGLGRTELWQRIREACDAARRA
jgi:GTP-binding protein